MSFMFNPYPYDDYSAINRPNLSKKTTNSISVGLESAVLSIFNEIKKILIRKNSTVVCMDGYVGAEWSQLINLLSGELTKQNIKIRIFDTRTLYKSHKEINNMLYQNLPLDKDKDPVLLFGKLFNGGYETIFEVAKLNKLKQKIEKTVQSVSDEKIVNIIYGAGSCFEGLLQFCDITVYFDVAPKEAVLRIKKGKYKNLGDETSRSFKEIMRNCYYFDFELAIHLRMKLIREDLIDFYIDSNNEEKIKVIPKEAFREICSSLVKYPLRAKPVYLEGVWGGYYMKKLRNLPEEMRNCAWSFELIPLEVSLLIEVGENLIEIPFFTFVCKEGVSLMGKECFETFKGYFPIRFNYDDTYHGSGNMSIQVHPPDKYIKDNFNEHGRQDESYYVIATGHGARTFVGLKEGSNTEEFIQAVKKSEIDFSQVDYEKYVNYIKSNPGMQFMLPSGTIHSSGRNQLVLEIGSLTVGSYTFKMYDYLRLDLDGVPRPIHTYHGERVLDLKRTSCWVAQNLVQKPRILRSGKDWAEFIIGEHDLMYFNLYRYEFNKTIEGNTNGVFHVLTLVDGKKISVYPKYNPERYYIQKYLDVVVIPANIGPYVIENLGDQPVCVHKTCLKENFKEYI